MADVISPLTTLAKHVAASATGELIAVGDGVEVHLYLQAGRIAWGTTTAERFVFRRHLEEHFQIDAGALQETLIDCQKTRRPLGESLITRNVLTLAQVREALRAQVASAVSSLEQCAADQMLFLPRGENFLSYDTRLTFSFDEIQGQSQLPLEVLHQLEQAVPQLTGAAVLAEGRVLASLRVPPPVSAIEELSQQFLEGAHLMVLRASGGNLIGGTLPQAKHSLWCGLPAKLSVSAAMAVVMHHSGKAVSDAHSVGPTGVFQEFGGTPHSVAGLQGILERAIFPAAVAVLGRESTPTTWALAREPLVLNQFIVDARHRQRALDADVFFTRPQGPNAELLGLAFQSVLVADGEWWWFGADLVTGEPASVWLMMPRSANQGLGWALLASVVRHLGVKP